MQTFVIIGGLPGSGKSTKARKLRSEKKMFVVSTDQLRLALNAGVYPRPEGGEYKRLEPVVWEIAELAVRRLLAKGDNVAIDATNLSRKRRAWWKDIARSVVPDVRVEIHWCVGKFDSAERWANERGHTLAEYQQIRSELEATVELPQPDEADEVVIG